MLYVTYNSIKTDRQVANENHKKKKKDTHETKLPTLYQNNRWKKICLVNSNRNMLQQI